MRTASIVVAAYNAQETIEPLIKSLLELDYPNKEIIIVNDGSTDKTAEIIKKYPVILINQPNQGASAARNNGLNHAKSEIIAYTDSDCVVARDWLKNLIKHFDDPEVGAVTGQTIFATDNHCTSWVRSLDIEERNNSRKKYTRLANGPNSAFRRDLLKKIGGFNPKWFHAEDTEVSYNIWKEGFKIIYEPNAIVHHVPENNWRKYLKKRYRDAYAFTRILWNNTKTAFTGDDYVLPYMKIQPPLFALTILSIPSAPAFIYSGYSKQYSILFLALIASGTVSNMPFAFRVAKKSKKTSFFFKTLLLTVARGFLWGVALLIGGVRNIKIIKSSTAISERR